MYTPFGDPYPWTIVFCFRLEPLSHRVSCRVSYKHERLPSNGHPTPALLGPFSERPRVLLPSGNPCSRPRSAYKREWREWGRDRWGGAIVFGCVGGEGAVCIVAIVFARRKRW